MNAVVRRGGGVILISVVIAYILAVLPLPDWAEAWRPEWAALVLIYWCMAVPHRVGVVAGWFMGLGQDMLQASLLGQHALAYALLAYLVLRLHQRLRVYPVPQQALIVLLLLFVVHLVQAWSNGLAARPVPTSAYWAPVLVGAVLWPAVFMFMRGVRRRFQVQ